MHAARTGRQSSPARPIGLWRRAMSSAVMRWSEILLAVALIVGWAVSSRNALFLTVGEFWIAVNNGQLQWGAWPSGWCARTLPIAIAAERPGVWYSTMTGLIDIWRALLLLSVPTTVSWCVHLRQRRRPAPGHCQNCGYNLTGNVSGRCPECGSTISPAQPRGDP